MNPFYDLNKRLADLAAKQDRRLDESKAAVDESAFSKLAKEIGKNPKVKNPAAVAATIGREKYGQKAMTAKSVAGKKAKHHEEMEEALSPEQSKRHDAKSKEAFIQICRSQGMSDEQIKRKLARWAKTPGMEHMKGMEEDFSPINEKFAEPAKKGMFAGKTKSELQKQYNHLKASGPHHKGTPEYTKMKELAFAIRAKSGWGKMDEEETDEGAGVMHFKDQQAKAKGEKTFKLGGKEFPVKEEKKEPRSKGTAFDPEVAKSMFAHKDDHPRYDVHDTGYSKRYTRKHEDDMEKDDDEVKSDAPKKKGRPKGPAKGPERTTKGAWKHKGERKVKEDGIPITDRGEYDNEGNEVKGDMHTVIRHATELEKHLRDQENLPTWVIEKIGQIKGMMASVSDYILSQHERGAEHETGEEGIRIAEKITKNTPTGDVIHDFVHSKNPKFAGKSKKERINQALGASYAMKKGKMEEGGKPDFLDLDKDGNKKESMKKAAKDKQAKEEKVDETTVAGSVATATTSGKSSKGGISYGKGVYEGFNTSVERMITEGMKVESNMDECGDMGQTPSVTVQADGEDAAKLMMLLKLAGLGHEEALEENELDWPTDSAVTGGDDPHLRRLSGGLNRPKSTGQTTVPVIAGQLNRMSTMEENVELERTLFKTWKNYKG